MVLLNVDGLLLEGMLALVLPALLHLIIKKHFKTLSLDDFKCSRLTVLWSLMVSFGDLSSSLGFQLAKRAISCADVPCPRLCLRTATTTLVRFIGFRLHIHISLLAFFSIFSCSVLFAFSSRRPSVSLSRFRSRFSNWMCYLMSSL